MNRFNLKSGRQEIKKQLGSEAAKQPSLILGCHPELVWQREQAQRSELCDPVPRWAGSQIVSRHSHADNLCLVKPSPDTTCHPLPEVEGNFPVLSPRESGLRAEGEAWWQNGKAIAGNKCRPVKREQPSRVRERVKHSFAKQTETSLPSCLPVIRKCAAFTLAEVFHPVEQSKRTAFTLAEVLITLGIIGVVAALTMPSLIQNHRKQVIETRLKKFYSSINQAVKLAEVDFGDKKLWYQDLAGAQKDEDGNIIEGSSESEKWFKKYLAPYIQITKFETLPNGAFLAYLPDGSAFGPNQDNTRDWFFYPSEPAKCINKNSADDMNGSCRFVFCFYPPKINIVWNAEHWKYHTDKGFEPNKYRWDGTEAQLLTGCEGTPAINHNHAFCTALIQYNNWKIPKDYPLKF